MTSRTLLAVVCLGVAVTASDVQAGVFAQLSSTQTQKAGKGPKVVTLNSTDAAKGIENKNGAVVVKEAGTYFVMASGQLGGSGKGTVKVWLRHNGKDVDNSTNEQTVEPGSTSVLICQAVLELKAADKVELVFSASSPELGLVASREGGAGHYERDLLGAQGGRRPVRPAFQHPDPGGVRQRQARDAERDERGQGG